MNQTALDLDALPTDHGDPSERTGFELGWDHAQHGLVPPAQTLQGDTPVSQGWLAGKAVFGRRTLQATRFVRLAQQLRTQAWQKGILFDHQQVTPQYLAQLQTPVCPVTRMVLGGLPGTASAPVVERLHAAAGFIAGNLVVVSQAAAGARAGCTASQAAAHARSIEAGKAADVSGLDAPAWWRLACLLSFVTPLSHLDAARMPLRALPPSGIRAVNPAQRLQAMLTVQLASPGWSGRLRRLAATLPDAGLRHDFNLFIGALAPRLLEAPVDADAMCLRHALEDAWADARVNRRWQHFIVQLGQTESEALLQRTPTPLPPRRSRAGSRVDLASMSSQRVLASTFFTLQSQKIQQLP